MEGTANEMGNNCGDCCDGCFRCSSGFLCRTLKVCFVGLFGALTKRNSAQRSEETSENETVFAGISKSNSNNNNNSSNSNCSNNNNNNNNKGSKSNDPFRLAVDGNNRTLFTRSLRRSSAKGQRRLTKNDIKYLIDQTCTDSSQTSSSSVTRLDSLTSRTSAGSATDSTFCRERYDSDRSQESASSLASCQNASVFERIRTYSFTSGINKRQPIVDVRPIEFWTSTKEQIQPRLTRLKLLSESGISLEDLRHDLYVSKTEADVKRPTFTLQHSKPQPQLQRGINEAERSSDVANQRPPSDGAEIMSDEDKLEKFQLGQIHISLHYSAEDEMLVVKIIEARNLPLPVAQDQNDHSHSNPYVKLSLVSEGPEFNDGWQQQQQQQQSQQTSVRRKTQSPVWDEKFHFRLSLKEALGRCLLLTVRDFDKYSRHCCIGQVTIDLGEVNLLKGGHFWRALVPAELTSPDLGNLLVSLNFLPAAGRLNVDILRAHQILQTNLTNATDCYVKVTQFLDDKEVKSRKTSSVRGTLDPEYDESLSFDLRSDQLQSCSLVFSVWSRQTCYPKSGSRSSRTLVGRFSMGKHSSGRREQAHWSCLAKYNRSPAARWHALLSKEDHQIKCAISAASLS